MHRFRCSGICRWRGQGTCAHQNEAKPEPSVGSRGCSVVGAHVGRPLRNRTISATSVAITLVFLGRTEKVSIIDRLLVGTCLIDVRLSPSMGRPPTGPFRP